jgi:hypothetical protein
LNRLAGLFPLHRSVDRSITRSSSLHVLGICICRGAELAVAGVQAPPAVARSQQTRATQRNETRRAHVTSPPRSMQARRRAPATATCAPSMLRPSPRRRRLALLVACARRSTVAEPLIFQIFSEQLNFLDKPYALDLNPMDGSRS